MKIYVSFKSYLWNFKGYEPPIGTNCSSEFVNLNSDRITEETIKEIHKIILKNETERYRKMTNIGSVEVTLLGITKVEEK